jgi:hypothetical protein
MPPIESDIPGPRIQAVRRALEHLHDDKAAADLLFLEAWELMRPHDLGATLRAAQIRRANRDLAAEIDAELHDRMQ